jgi:hypothetical protein
LPSASTYAHVENTLARFTYRGFAPHKFTPMLGVHKSLERTGLGVWVLSLREFTAARFQALQPSPP